MKVNLGDKVKDTVSGFIGIAVSRHIYLNGCNRITVQPSSVRNGKLPESQTFDEPQLKVLKTQQVLPGLQITGGPDKYTDEGR
jgi:hypothetical protein